MLEQSGTKIFLLVHNKRNIATIYQNQACQKNRHIFRLAIYTPGSICMSVS